MNDINEKSKASGNTKTKKQERMPAEAKEGLEPCDKPQAQEALRPNVIDDACDDGVD
jgi:hypothetical protein